MILLFAGTGWDYSNIVQEIAAHHDPKVVLAVLRFTGRHKILSIAAIISVFGAGMVVMDLIRKHASKKEINEAIQIVSLVKKGEY